MKRILSSLGAIALAGSLAIAADKPKKAPGGPRGEGGHQRPNPEEFIKKLDTDHSGGLSLDEFKAHRPNGGPAGGGGGEGKRPGGGGQGPGANAEGPAGGDKPAHPNPEEIFKKLDKDGNHVLSPAEFNAPRHHGGPDGPGKGPKGGGKAPGGGGNGPGGAPVIGS